MAVLLGYLRVSRGDDQSTAPQRRALAQAGVERFFEETASGGRWDRPELHRLLDQLRAEDVVVVWKMDRLSRSLKDLLAVLERIEMAGPASGPGRAHDDADGWRLHRVRARHNP